MARNKDFRADKRQMGIRITFVSNFINHHQIPFCEELYGRLKEDFAFIQVMPMDSERAQMGWNDESSRLPYLHKFYEEEDSCSRLIRDCDVLLLGWTGQSSGDKKDIVINERLSSGKPVIRVSERIYREGRYKAISPRGLAAKYHEHVKYRKKPVFMLCAGAYVSGDFKLIGAYPGKMFKWGYFPPFKEFDNAQIEDLFYKEGDELRISFVARLIKLKHPEFALYAAEFLKNKGIKFHMDIVGDGPLRKELEEAAAGKGLLDEVTFCGAMEPDKVRQVMEKSHLFIFASNYLEGWGAVVNEAMNSACAVIASAEAGAVPFLVKNRENGLLYEGCKKEEFLADLDYLIRNPEKIRVLQRAAYETISTEWNAHVAGDRFLNFCRKILENPDNLNDIPKSGPMSRAEILKAPGFFRTFQEDNHLE